MRPFYQLFDHTSDLGVQVRAEDLKSLFKNAALTLTDLMTDIKTVRNQSDRIIEVEAENIELLLREWLSELLFTFHTSGFLVSDVDVLDMSVRRFKARIFGEQYQKKRHVLQREIKSVTYHQLKVIVEEHEATARFILDI
ncbi:MAG: archease [Candidatus Marinimicrobia bacterium]|nr:archease [Candidatus Neomarinimicrobiota bacterium]